MPDRTLEITLDRPIKHEGGEITVLKLREPTGAEMQAAEKRLTEFTPETLTAFQVAVVGAVSGLKEDALNELPVSVMRRAAEFVLAFGDQASPDGEPAPELHMELPEPLASGGVTYTGLGLSEPTVGMRRQAETALRTGQTPANARQYQMVLVSKASGVPFEVAQKLPVSVLNAAEAYLRGFLQPGRPTGSG